MERMVANFVFCFFFVLLPCRSFPGFTFSSKQILANTLVQF